jgi:hypothetical protein
VIAFTYTGKLDGHDTSGSVTADGKILGNPFVAIRVKALIRNQVNVGLGPYAGPATLDDPILARATIAAIIPNPSFDPSVETEALPPDTVS